MMTLNKKKFLTLASPNFEPDVSAMQIIMKEVAKEAMERHVISDNRLMQSIGVNKPLNLASVASMKCNRG